MPIIRTHDIDDDGTGTTGTPRNAAWKEELYDQIDAALGTVPTGTIPAPFRFPGNLTFLLTQPSYNNFAPPGNAAFTVWLLQGDQPCTLTGVTAEAEGTQHLIINGAGFPLTLASGDTASLTANQFLCPRLTSFVLEPWYTSVWIHWFTLIGKWLVVQR